MILARQALVEEAKETVEVKDGGREALPPAHVRGDVQEMLHPGAAQVEVYVVVVVVVVVVYRVSVEVKAPS